MEKMSTRVALFFVVNPILPSAMTRFEPDFVVNSLDSINSKNGK